MDRVEFAYLGLGIGEQAYLNVVSLFLSRPYAQIKSTGKSMAGLTA
jgi:hypothetical protein